ncbi:MAG: ASCH domain-containing protein [Pseudomonadota bacterium]
MIALSIRQPFAEQIFTEQKKTEYRSRPAKIRGRIYIYACKGKSEFLTGVIIGIVELYDCKKGEDGFEWLLRNPQRIPLPFKPENHPQPAWFNPFKS